MKVGGSFTVHWQPQDGVSVTIVSTSVKYSSSSNGTIHPTSGWQTTIPSVQEGMFLWTWTHVTYSDGTQTDAYSVSRNGIDGRGITSSAVSYSLQATSVSPESITSWGNFPATLIDGYWLYTKTVITYSDGEPSTSYSVAQVGTGAYYAGTQEYYNLSDNPTQPPTGYPYKQGESYPLTYPNGQAMPVSGGWSQDRPTPNYDTPYIWNFEVSYDSRGNKYVTLPICIGNFSRGISSVVEAYAISAYGVVPSGRLYPADISTWQDEQNADAPTNEKPYKWNRTVTTYNDGSSDTIYHVCAVRGQDGKGSVYIDIENEHVSMQYDGNGNRVGSAETCNIRLYENGQEVPGVSYPSFVIDDKPTSVTASISGKVLIISGLSSDTGYVVVKCIYKQASYYARVSIARLQNEDKYELICTPNAVSHNTTTGNASATSIGIKIYRISISGTRELVNALSAYSLALTAYLNNTTSGSTVSYANGNGTFSFVPSSTDSIRLQLTKGDNVMDSEVIPVGHVANGAAGESAFVLSVDNQNTGVVCEDNGSVTTQQTHNVTCHAYYGSSDVLSQCSSFTAALERSGDATFITSISANKSTGVVSFSSNAGGTWTKGKVVNIILTAVHATYGTRTAKISVSPVFGGARAEYYELAPSLSAVSFTKSSDGKSLAPSSRSLTVQCWHIRAGQQPEKVSIPSGFSVRYSFLSQPTTTSQGTSYSSGLSISNATTDDMLYLSLFNGSSLCDTQTLPILRGGVDGADNIGVSIDLDHDMSSFPMSYDGKTESSSTHSNHVAMYVGSALQTFTALTYSTSASGVIVSVATSNGHPTGDVTVTIPTNKTYANDRVEVTFLAKSSSVPDGRSITFTIQGVRAGRAGEKPVLYDLLPSRNTISFARQSNGNLLPSYTDIYCGYQKTQGTTVTNYSGNIKANLWKEGGAPYNIMYRYATNSGTYTSWSWAKDLTSPAIGTLRVYSSTEYTSLEYVLTSASSTSDVADANIIDRETIPITKDGTNGTDGMSYWLETSLDEITRSVSGDLSATSVSCTAYSRSGSKAAVVYTGGTLRYHYFEGSVQSSDISYSGEVTVGMWWSRIVFELVIEGHVSAKKEVLVKNDLTNALPNLLNDTAFDSHKDITTVYDDSLVEGGGPDGHNVLNARIHDMMSSADTTVFRQRYYQTGASRVMSGEYYTVSFRARALGYNQIDVNVTSYSRIFANKQVRLVPGTYTFQISSELSSAASSAGFVLAFELVSVGLSPAQNISLATKSGATVSTVIATGTIQVAGTYEIRAVISKNGQTPTMAQTATVYYYRVVRSTRVRKCMLSLGSGTVDLSYARVLNGEPTSSVPADSTSGIEFSLSTQWHDYSFTYRNVASGSTTRFLDVIIRNNDSATGYCDFQICDLKLERSVFPTGWCASSLDNGGYNGARPDFVKWSSFYGTQRDVYAGIRGDEVYTIVFDDRSEHDRKWYVPRQTHRTTATEDITDASKWLASSMDFVATSVFFAQMAYIENLGVKNVLLSDGHNISGGMCANDDDGNGGTLNLGRVRLWLGSDKPQQSPFSVDVDGNFTANTGQFSGLVKQRMLCITELNAHKYIDEAWSPVEILSNHAYSSGAGNCMKLNLDKLPSQFVLYDSSTGSNVTNRYQCPNGMPTGYNDLSNSFGIDYWPRGFVLDLPTFSWNKIDDAGWDGWLRTYSYNGASHNGLLGYDVFYAWCMMNGYTNNTTISNMWNDPVHYPRPAAWISFADDYKTTRIRMAREMVGCRIRVCNLSNMSIAVSGVMFAQGEGPIVGHTNEVDYREHPFQIAGAYSTSLQYYTFECVDEPDGGYNVENIYWKVTKAKYGFLDKKIMNLPDKS